MSPKMSEAVVKVHRVFCLNNAETEGAAAAIFC